MLAQVVQTADECGFGNMNYFEGLLDLDAAKIMRVAKYHRSGSRNNVTDGKAYPCHQEVHHRYWVISNNI